jgi:MOSC domain-containing protein YiiM
MTALDEVTLEAGKGLPGDRYFKADGTTAREAKDGDTELTLIEAEEIERFNELLQLTLDLGALRRNIVTRGVRLNALVGRRFRIGPVELEGVRLCEPCAHLAKTVCSKVLPAMVHRAGLRACIVSGGTVRPGDPVVE